MRWPFTCLEAIPPVLITEYPAPVSKGRANVVAPAACPCSILPAMRLPDISPVALTVGNAAVALEWGAGLRQIMIAQSKSIIIDGLVSL